MSASFIYAYSELSACVPRLWQEVKAYPILIFQGEMGAGKTTFIRYLTAFLGMPTLATSPTFSLVNTYKNADLTLHHMDFFRLTTDRDFHDLDLPFYLALGTHCLIEWGDKFLPLFPKPYALLAFEYLDSSRRRVRLSFFPI